MKQMTPKQKAAFFSDNAVNTGVFIGKKGKKLPLTEIMEGDASKVVTAGKVSQKRGNAQLICSCYDGFNDSDIEAVMLMKDSVVNAMTLKAMEVSGLVDSEEKPPKKP